MRAAAALLASFLAACAGEATQIIVAVDTDLSIPGEVTSIRLDLTSPDGATATRVVPLAGAESLPVTLAVLRTREPHAPLVVVASALRDGAPEPVLSVRVRAAFEPGQTRLLRILLLRECAAATCTGETTCRTPGAACSTVDVATEAFAGAPGRFAPGLFDAGTPPPDAGPEGGLDSGVPPPDAGDGGTPPPDAGCGCMLGGECRPGTARDACGTGGAACTVCDECASDVCEAGRCVPADPVIGIAHGIHFACFLVEGGAVWCAGDNELGQLGNGTTSAGDTVPRPATSTGFTSVAGGADNCLALLAGSPGPASYWGIRPGDSPPDPPATTATSLGTGSWRVLAAGGYHLCGLDGAGALSCFGENTYGQLGIGSTGLQTMFTAVPGEWSDVSAGLYHTCAIGAGATAGQLFCWGSGGRYQLGNGMTANQSRPVRVGTRSDWEQIENGKDFTCARRAGEVWCWGDNGSGSAGGPTAMNVSAPLQLDIGGVPIADAIDLDSGRFHSCLIRTDGSLWCWGTSHCGEVGNGVAMRELPEPQRVEDPPGHGTAWSTVAAGHTVTCAARTDGSLWCWGRSFDRLVAALTDCPLAADRIPRPARVCL